MVVMGEEAYMVGGIGQSSVEVVTIMMVMIMMVMIMMLMVMMLIMRRTKW